MANDPYADDRDDSDRDDSDRDDYDSGADDRIGDDEPDDYRDDEATRAETTEYESWWDEWLITLLLLAGLVLLLFPEPATSGIGIALLAVGAVLWVFDWFA